MANSRSAVTTKVTTEWQAFWLAIGFLTRIPMLARIEYSPRLMNQSSLYFPVVGLLLGGIYAATYSLLAIPFSALVSVLLVMSLHLWLTGAFHEDGLADSVDALGGGYTVEKRLEIMKDSHIGTYGTVALVMALVLKAALLVQAPQVWLALLVAPVVARLTPLLLMSRLPYVSNARKSKSKAVADGLSWQRLLLGAGFTVLTVLAFSPWAPALLLWCLLATVGVAATWGWYLKGQLGGYTGDTLGASVVLAELVLLLLMAG